MTGMAGAISLFARHTLRHSLAFVVIILILAILGRIVLVLPFCPQPRLELTDWNLILGGILLVLSPDRCCGPLFYCSLVVPAKPGMTQRTSGIYGVVRHPIYLSELLWPLGLALIFRSLYGAALTPLWWLALLIHALSEEAELERALGSEYLEYRKKVRGRIFPGLPF